MIFCRYEDIRATPLWFRKMASCYEDFRTTPLGMLLLCRYEEIRVTPIGYDDLCELQRFQG